MPELIACPRCDDFAISYGYTSTGGCALCFKKRVVPLALAIEYRLLGFWLTPAESTPRIDLAVIAALLERHNRSQNPDARGSNTQHDSDKNIAAS